MGEGANLPEKALSINPLLLLLPFLKERRSKDSVKQRKGRGKKVSEVRQAVKKTATSKRKPTNSAKSKRPEKEAVAIN
jgi:hypothetical protein